jgi:ribose transport system permease protein
MNKKFGASAVLERAGLPVFLGLLIVFFWVVPATDGLFMTSSNIQNILANQTVTGLIALAMLTPLLAGYFDLSASAIAGVSNVTVGALLATYHDSVFVAIVIGVLFAVAIGAMNGFLVAVLRLNAFITTIGTYILISGLLNLYTQGRTINAGIPLSFSLWSGGKWFGISRTFWLLIIAALAMWFLVRQTPFGRRLVAIGSNESAARLAGFRVDRTVFLTFVISGFVAGLAGALLTSQNGGADSTTAISYLFPALAAVFLGQTAINPGQPNVWGTMFAVFLVAVGVDGFTLMGAADWLSQVFNGVALILAVALSTFMARSRERRARIAQLEALRADTAANSPGPPDAIAALSNGASVEGATNPG